jgi:2-hydroxycyclohexanecarboxyl-CoA dehydrogenase
MPAPGKEGTCRRRGDDDGDGAGHLAKEIAADGGRAAGCRTDVGNRADVDRAVDLARGEFGPVGILVTSAGVTNVEPFSRMTLESWNRVIGINLTGTFHCAQAVLPDMVDAGWGRIVFISSSSAQRGAPRTTHPRKAGSSPSRKRWPSNTPRPV